MFRILIAGNFIIAALTALRWQSLPPQIPLFLSKPWGEEQLADRWMLIIFPICINGIWLVNTFISKRFFARNLFAQKIINIASICQMIVFIGIFVKIIVFVT